MSLKRFKFCWNSFCQQSFMMYEGYECAEPKFEKYCFNLLLIYLSLWLYHLCNRKTIFPPYPILFQDIYCMHADNWLLKTSCAHVRPNLLHCCQHKHMCAMELTTRENVREHKKDENHWCTLFWAVCYNFSYSTLTDICLVIWYMLTKYQVTFDWRLVKTNGSCINTVAD